MDGEMTLDASSSILKGEMVSHRGQLLLHLRCSTWSTSVRGVLIGRIDVQQMS